MNFKEEYTDRVEKIEKILKKYLPEKKGYQRTIMEAMEYSLMAGGKRLRPMLMWESYRLFGGEGAAIEPFMAAIEMIHTYSLVHDDLPAMDNDEYRRGRKTTHIVYGEDMGILAGDALLNYAFETACRAFEEESEHALRIGKALKILADKAGIYGMIGGQVVDVHGSALVGIRHFLVINFVEPIVGCNGTGVGQDQTAYRIGHSGIFLYPPVVDFQVVVHQVLVVQQSGVHVANLFSLFPVQDIRLGHISIARIGQDFFHAVLDAFHTNQVVFDLRVKVSCHLQSHHIDNTGMIVLMQCLKGLCNCLTDFGNFEVYDFAIPFYHRIHG